MTSKPDSSYLQWRRSLPRDNLSPLDNLASALYWGDNKDMIKDKVVIANNKEIRICWNIMHSKLQEALKKGEGPCL